MTITHCDLDLGTGDNNGTSWANAYQGDAGFVTGYDALAAGDTMYVKDNSSGSTSRTGTGVTTLAAATNPARVIGVKAATTNEGGSIVQSDLIPGFRTGDSTAAYAQTSTNAAPILTLTSSADLVLTGSIYFYGIVFISNDALTVVNANAVVRMTFDECKLELTGSSDVFTIGTGSSSNMAPTVIFRNSIVELLANHINLLSSANIRAYNTIINTTNSSGYFRGAGFNGLAQFFACDLSGSNATMVLMSDFNNGVFEFWNCKMVASHILTTGTATDMYTVANYGSEDSTSLGSSDSEQQLEIHTHMGTVDIEPSRVRTNGADDSATGGHSWAMVANNVTDNFVAVVSPWMYVWASGDGTAQTLTVFIANSSASTDRQTDEVFLEVVFPSEAGISQYDYRPDAGAPGDGGGQAQLLAAAADLTNDTGSSWGTGANNHQTLSQSIAPDYQGWVYCRVHDSKASGDTLYVDPFPVLS